MPVMLNSLAPILTGPTLVEELLKRLTQWAVNVSKQKRARVFLLDRARQELHCRSTDTKEAYALRLPIGQGLHGEAFSSGTLRRGRSAETGDALLVAPVFSPTTNQTEESEVIALLELAGESLEEFDEERLAHVTEGVARVLTHARLDDSRLAPERITELVGSSASMLDLYAAMQQLATVRTPIVLSGAYGVGKSRIATAIHHLALGKSAPLVTVHCHTEQAFVEAELFGLPSTATSTGERMLGAIERASNGTLLVEQVNLLPSATQERLIEQAELCNARVIATVLRVTSANGTNPPIADQLASALRTQICPIPTIAERGPDDVAMLARHFVREWTLRFQRPNLSIDTTCLARLRSQSWPGNVQALERCLESAVLVCDGDTIEARHLCLPGPGGNSTASDSIPSGLLLADAEERYILRTLTENSQNRTRTANSLGIGRNTLVRKIKQYQNK